MKHNTYCAFCRTPRRIYTKKNIGFFEVLYSFIAGLAGMYFLWQEFDPKFILFTIVFIAIAETFTQIRWRLSIVCHQCGFDPVLYLKKPLMAAEKVKKHLEIRREDPRYLLAPPLNLPTISKEKAVALQNNKNHQGQLLSKQV